MASTARLDELKKKFDENPRRYFAPLANELRKSGDLDQAISLCRAHLPLQPAHISGHIVLAQALFEAGSVDESRDIFLAALGLDPENLIALRYLGDIAREAHDVETARSWYQRVLEVDPRNDEIVQMVRDLDAPRPAAPAAEVDEPSVSEATASVAQVPVRATPAADDPRYATLSMEDFDVGADEAVAEPVGEKDAAPASADVESFDVHAAWNDASPPVESPMMETEEIDPFDLHPSASAESLFDAGSDAASDDFFLTELSGVDTPDDISEPAAPYEADAWSAATTVSDAASDSPSAEAETVAFEEGAFYSADEAPSVTASTAPVVHAAAEAEPIEEPVQPSTPSPDAVEPVAAVDHNADALALFADRETAEWQPPAAAVDETLGLEVMEFVPPSTGEFATAVNDVSSYLDSSLGDSEAPASSEQASTPPAFVTETMAELYLQQGFRSEALAVYRELLARNPADASLRERVERIESGSASSIGMASLSENVVESARKRRSGRSSQSVRSFFASLADRRVPNAASAPVDYDATDQGNAPADVSAPEMAGPETVPIAELAADLQSEPVAETPEAHQAAPSITAAEALAAFDPFADNSDVSNTAPTAQETPNVAGSAMFGAPTLEYVAEPPSPEPTAEAESLPARRSLEDLFPDTPVTARSEAVAQTLATAFGRDEPQGRPTRAASNELSLDHVFRGSPEGASTTDGGFSFDQFFSDARPAGGDVSTAPALSAPSHGRGGSPTDANDIEQFTAWLEGLKKK